ncbi:MAG: ComEC/Rec2 family competence protein [Paracoccus sp. (in: a-proteobacteria)]|uniref:ComEC/Rec2 family competence protein n=1 Tax=Paracoccus sp. TaxID=267 RepID=UPI0039199835
MLPRQGAGIAPAVAVPGFADNRALRPRPPAAPRAGLLAWLPVCLGAGIGLWFLWPALLAPWVWVALAGLVSGALLVARCAPGWAGAGFIGWPLADGLRLAGLAVALLAGGFALAGGRAGWVAAPVMEWRYYGPVEGRVVQIDRSARDRLRLTLDQVILRDHSPDRVPRKVRLSLTDHDGGGLPPIGQRVMLTGHLGPPPGPAAPGSFDFRLNAWFQGLGAVGYSRTPIMAVAPPEGGRWQMHRARMALSATLQDRIAGQPGAVAAALMTGDRSGITEATTELMRASNLSHVIAISGLHMGLLAGFVYATLRLSLVLAEGLGARLPLPAHKLSALGALLAAAGYLWLSGASVATQRAFVTVAVMLLAILADRRAISLRTVALAATAILILSPEALTSPGFQMSFAATIALILVFGPWTRHAGRLPFWARPVLMLLVSSLVAGLATAPIGAAHFNRMSQYGLLANMLAVPVMGTLIIPSGVIALLLSPLGLEGPALWLMGLGTGWMLRVAGFVAGLDGAVIAIRLPPVAVLPLLSSGAVGLVLCWRGRAGLRHLSPLSAGCALSALMMTAGTALWLTASRPLVLIAPEGEAVGILTPAGRVVSKPAGGSFVVSTWLVEDGDSATQVQSADRPLWQGDTRDRRAPLPHGWQIGHFTGKGSGTRAGPFCAPRRILVATEPVPDLGTNPPCLIFDLARLRRTGAVALDIGPDGPVWRSVTGVQPALRPR